MNKKNILHIMVIDKFIPPFIKFIENNFTDSINRHQFFIFGESQKFPIEKKTNIFSIKQKPKISDYFHLLQSINNAEKIILHGLFSPRINQILSIHPWILKKCYWAIWGGDLYIHSNHKKNWRWLKDEIFRRFIIKRIGHLITYVDGDIELARKWYGAKGIHHECIMYTSNVYHEPNIIAEPHNTINIQIGNSADPSNNHFEILEMLIPYRNENISIYAPLSYGNQEYAKNLISFGKKQFGEKFHPILEIMPIKDYLKFLGEIDIAIFNHNRQQAMGNTITLLGLGKKVYLRSDISSWLTIQKNGAIAFDIRNLSLSPIDKETIMKNKAAIKKNFSNEKLFNQLDLIFNYAKH